MPKYRGFKGERIDRFDLSGLGQWRVSRNGSGGGFVAPRPPVVAYTPPPVTVIPVTQGGVTGDIRDLSARSQPGEAIDVDPAGAVDDMSAENGVPGVDDSGRFPYGDPRSAEKAPPKMGENTGLIIAAIIAALVLGG